MSEKSPLKEKTDQIIQKIFDRYKELGARVRSSAEEFREVFKMFNDEYNEATPDQKKDILAARYFSAHAGDYQMKLDSHAVFFDKDKLLDLDVEVGNINKTRNEQELESSDDLIELMKYGSSRVFDVQPGGWCIVKSEDQDIVASSLFSCCAGVVARSQDFIGFAHIRMGDVKSTKFMAELFAKKLEGAEITLFLAKSESEDEELDKNINDRVQKMIDELLDEGIKVNPHYYPYINAGMKNNPHKQNSATLIAGEDMVRAIGVKEEFKKSGMQRKTVLNPIKETIEDLG